MPGDGHVRPGHLPKQRLTLAGEEHGLVILGLKVSAPQHSMGH